jgi:hypothetical protein
MAVARTSASRSSPSAKDWAAKVLENRGFEFVKVETTIRRTRYERSIDDAWANLHTILRKHTKLRTARIKNTTDVSNRFVEMMKGNYKVESEFMAALLQFLRFALGDFVSVEIRPEQDLSSLILLKLDNAEEFEGRNVGFATTVDRKSHLRLGEDIGLSKGCKTDIACVVLGNDGIVETTAVVELKLGQSSCKDYTVNSGECPNLENDHAPLAQALYYTHDTFYCLARRGIKLLGHLPVVVVAALKQQKAEPDRLCCMNASLKIPEYLGETFRYQIEKCVKFPTDEIESRVVYLQVLLIFVDTLSTGLRYAFSIAREQNNSPLTLCSLNPIPEVKLLASPIPAANAIDVDSSSSETKFTINQGELYRYEGTANTKVQDWLDGFTHTNRNWETLLFTNPEGTMDHAIVKISCLSVHSPLIPISESWGALEKIHSTVGMAEKDEMFGNAKEKDMEKIKMKATMAKVLLGCAQIRKYCLVVVMRELLRDPPDTMTPCGRWEAFGRLVENVFCPMAELKIVHADIRFNPEKKILHNIVYYDNEMACIDFESLTSHPIVPPLISQVSAISDAANASRFVFLQVLWAAFVWTREQDYNFDEIKTSVFVEELDKNFDSLRNYLAIKKNSDLNRLKKCYASLLHYNADDKSCIMEAMQLLQSVCFPDVGSSDT